MSNENGSLSDYPAPRRTLSSLRPDGAPPLVLGHRGASADAPENTLAAFRLLLDRGIEAVELDIHQCASGELVVAHDEDLDRTAGVNLNIRETPLPEIRRHDVGAWFGPEYAGERVPLLSEVFALLGDALIYDIEVKPCMTFHQHPEPGGIEQTLNKLIRDAGLESRCIVSSFDPMVLRRFSRITREIPTALIYTNSKKAPAIVRHGRGRLLCNPDILKPESTIITTRFMEKQHRRGRQVLAWTVDDPDVAAQLAASGVEGIITNKPTQIRDAVV